ncbi:aspartate 1-decarboxylase [Mesorhizobium sp. M0203]|uniref:aspartate 1-decarboxylase n=1 Tax=Mesorhizobium sp. M0203 TaxID=2956912 RepID=UPI0033381230
MVAGKLHGIHVTEQSSTTTVRYCSTLTARRTRDPANGFVETWSKTSGARISTYVILGERGSRCCILNGAAARNLPAHSIHLDEAHIPV